MTDDAQGLSHAEDAPQKSAQNSGESTTEPSCDRQLKPESLWRSVASFLALGFGSGLSPKAPGTAGTLAAVPLLMIMPEQLHLFALIVSAMLLIGVWCCGRCANELGVHDHPAIVWDEIAAYLLVMLTLPITLGWIVAAFVVFRLFDILKPWPIYLIDKHVHGGLGIMLDDLVAAIYSILVLQLALHVLS